MSLARNSRAPQSPQELYNQLALAGPNTKILVTPNPELLKFGGATGAWRIKPRARKQKSAADDGPGGGNSAGRPDRIAPARPKSRESDEIAAGRLHNG